MRCFFEITLRKVSGEIRSAFFLAFLYSAMSFLIVLLIGGGPRFTTIEVAIYQAIKVDFEPALAVRLALIQMALAAITYLGFVVRRPTSRQGNWLPLYLFRKKRLNQLAVAAYFLFLSILVGGPLLSLLVSGLKVL